MAYLKVENLGKTYGENVILEGISFTAEPGDSIAFVSPSGSGKSTLLSMLGLLLSSTTGTVIVDGKDSDSMGDKEASALRRETFGFVFQHTQLVGSLRAIENVTAPASFAGKMPFDARRRAQSLLTDLGLAEPYESFSVSAKHRAEATRFRCARLAARPPIVIADEPTNDLDSSSSQSVADTLFSRVEEGGILLYATHDPGACFAREARNAP